MSEGERGRGWGLRGKERTNLPGHSEDLCWPSQVSIPISPSRRVEMKSSNQHSPTHFDSLAPQPFVPNWVPSPWLWFRSSSFLILPRPPPNQLPPGLHLWSQLGFALGFWGAITSLYPPSLFPCPSWLPAKLYSQPLLQLDGTVWLSSSPWNKNGGDGATSATGPWKPPMVSLLTFLPCPLDD